MTVRAKFTLISYETSLHTQYPRKEDGSWDYENPEQVEKRTLRFTPVSGDSSENETFWDATPSGSLELGVVNSEAWKNFEIGKSYYLDFTLAE